MKFSIVNYLSIRQLSLLCILVYRTFFFFLIFLSTWVINFKFTKKLCSPILRLCVPLIISITICSFAFKLGRNFFLFFETPTRSRFLSNNYLCRSFNFYFSVASASPIKSYSTRDSYMEPFHLVLDPFPSSSSLNRHLIHCPLRFCLHLSLTPTILAV